MMISNEPKTFFESYTTKICHLINDFDSDGFLAVINKLGRIRQSDGRVIIVGNGGSAAMASHVSVDFTKNTGIPSINFNEADLITCFANDYGYENWVVEALKAYSRKEDLIILISSSGQSANIINAANYAKNSKLPIVTFSGFSPQNPLRKMGTHNFWVNSTNYNLVEMTHHVWLCMIVDSLFLTEV